MSFSYNKFFIHFDSNNLPLSNFKLGDVSQAKALYNQAAKGLEKTLGRDHPDTVQILNNLAKVEN